VRYGYFYLPEVDGVVCNVSEPVQAEPLDWIVPPACNISGDYVNSTRVLQYYLPLDIIPAGTTITLTINNIRNPLQFATCNGWFDLQVRQQSDFGLMMVGRAVTPCQILSSAGALDLTTNFSNVKAGCAGMPACGIYFV
jgi:hypothetical protein